MTIKKSPNSIFAFFAVSAIILVFFTTSGGINIISDSVTYLQTSNNIAAGVGVQDYSGHTLAQMIHFPPLYPAILSIFIKLGIDPLSGARAISAIAFAIIIFFVGKLTYGASKSLWAAFFASCFVLFSSTAVLIHSFVLTEPSFIVFALSSFIMLALYFKLNKFYLFFISALLASLSILDRYVGVSVIATGIMCILLWEKGIIIARIKKSFLFGVVSMFPISLWLIHNYLIAGTFTDRIFSFHLITLDNIFLFFITLSEWVVPYWHNIFIGILFLVFIITVLVVCIKQRTKLFKEATTTEVFYLRIIDILIIFIIFYLFFIFFSTSFFDALTPFNYRILAPVYFSIIIVLASIVPRFIKNIYFTVAISLLCLISIAYGTYIITIINSQGLGFTKESITSSSVGAEILSIPKESTIYTNVPHMVYVLSKRLSYMFPQKQNPHAIILNDEYKNEFDKMIRGIEQGNSYILYITMSDFYDPRMQMPTLDEIKSAFSSDIVERVTEDATVFYRE